MKLKNCKNSAFTPKIIFFDIDQTLYLTEQRIIPQSAIKALHALQQKGIITAIATGRTIAALPDAVNQLIAEGLIELIVSINGQFVQYQGKELVSFPMPINCVQQVCTLLQQYNVAHALVSHSGISVPLKNAVIDDIMQQLGIPFTIIERAETSHRVFQMLAFCSANEEKLFLSKLPENLKLVRWHPYGVDILPAIGSKAKGIQAALAQLDLSIADAMAFGDGLNDIEMIQAVGLGVAMGNAANELKKVAQYVCPAIHDDGIYQALKFFQLID